MLESRRRYNIISCLIAGWMKRSSIANLGIQNAGKESCRVRQRLKVAAKELKNSQTRGKHFNQTLLKSIMFGNTP